MSRRAFSLVEMIVVLGILMVLMSILMPVVGNARDAANGTLCALHIRTLTQAFLSFAADHDGHLPGSRENQYVNSDPNPDHWDWLFGQYAWYASDLGGSIANLRTQLTTAPQYGTIWRYVNNNSYAMTGLPQGGSYQTYRCPSLTVTIPGSGSGSNGQFDYAFFSVFQGAMLKDISATSTMHWIYDNTLPSNPSLPSPNPNWYPGPPGITRNWAIQNAVLPTPIICQEDAQYNINTNLEGSHNSYDWMAHLHRGGSYYGSIDGSINWVNEPDLDLHDYWWEGTNLWEIVPPSGVATVQLNTTFSSWNWNAVTSQWVGTYITWNWWGSQ